MDLEINLKVVDICRRKIDYRGRVIFPKNYINDLGIENSDQVSIALAKDANGEKYLIVKKGE